jgi:phage shock protein A
MSIFKRISDIITANLNDMVESYEDPEQMLRQAIREMEDAIAESKPAVAKAMAHEKTTRKQLESNERESQRWAASAATAVEAGDDDLARKALSRKREYDKIVAALRDEQEASSDAAQVLRRQLEGMQAKLKDGQRRLGTLTARTKAASVRSKIAKSDAGLSADIDQSAFAKFDRLEKKVEMAEAEAEALSELTRSERAAISSDEQLGASADGDLELEAELAALKQAKQQSGG